MKFPAFFGQAIFRPLAFRRERNDNKGDVFEEGIADDFLENVLRSGGRYSLF